MNSYLAVMHEIHVLFVDHELNCLNTTRLLETCQYRVTHVAVAADAMLMLSNGKLKFDFVIANINSPDLQGFKLLQLAVSMEIPIILMSVDDDTITAMRVIEIGAFLYIKRPTTMEMLRCLWQHVAREKARAMREHERLMAVPNYVENPNFNNLEKGGFRKDYYKGRQVDEEQYNSDNGHGHGQGKVKRKICTEWTQELHEKFLDAVEQLGEGRCFPKEILELMNVPGLTRMQVASHLQKCRNDNWRSPDERKSSLGSYPMLSDGEGSHHKPRRFGSMPRVDKAPSDVYSHSGGGQGSRGEMGARVAQTMMNNQITYHQQHYGALVPHPDDYVPASINSSNPRHLSTDAFFSLDTDCLIQNLSDQPQGFVGMNHPQSSSRPLPFESVYAHDQINSKAASIDSGSHWTGSENSNFCSDNSQAKAN